MKERELAEVVEQQQYFEAVPAPSPEEDEGTRDMGSLYPFLISGGTNTERYYFTHINDTTEYKYGAQNEAYKGERGRKTPKAVYLQRVARVEAMRSAQNEMFT